MQKRMIATTLVVIISHVGAELWTEPVLPTTTAIMSSEMVTAMMVPVMTMLMALFSVMPILPTTGYARSVWQVIMAEKRSDWRRFMPRR